MNLTQFLSKLRLKFPSVSRGASLGILMCSPWIEFANVKLNKILKQVRDKWEKILPYLGIYLCEAIFYLQEL